MDFPGGQLVDGIFAVRDVYNAGLRLKRNIDEFFKPSPVFYDSRSRVAVPPEFMAIDREDAEARDRQTSSSRPSRASQRGDSALRIITYIRETKLTPLKVVLMVIGFIKLVIAPSTLMREYFIQIKTTTLLLFFSSKRSKRSSQRCR